MNKYSVTLTVNESEGLFGIIHTANFQVPANFKEFEVYGDNLDTAIHQVKQELRCLANDEIELDYTNDVDFAKVTFSNYEDVLGITYEIHKQS